MGGAEANFLLRGLNRPFSAGIVAKIIVQNVYGDFISEWARKDKSVGSRSYFFYAKFKRQIFGFRDFDVYDRMRRDVKRIAGYEVNMNDKAGELVFKQRYLLRRDKKVLAVRKTETWSNLERIISFFLRAMMKNNKAKIKFVSYDGKERIFEVRKV